jgi:ABC-type phosphate/phosphonate transport system ATPase subunit
MNVAKRSRGCGGLAGSPTASITGGALMQEPDLLLADEPTSSLDPKTSVEIMELISNGESHVVPAGSRMTVLVVEDRHY